MSNMLIDSKLAEIRVLCRRHGVRKLELFGSATADTFDQHLSDIDFLVDFDPGGKDNFFRRYFRLNEDLEALFGRKVDLVMVGALANRHFIDSVNKSRLTVYAAPVAEAA
jgi:predicted nucleotidyltransferase